MQSLQDKHFTLSTAALVRMVQDARERTLALVADLEEAQFEVPAHIGQAVQIVDKEVPDSPVSRPRLS